MGLMMRRRRRRRRVLVAGAAGAAAYHAGKSSGRDEYAADAAYEEPVPAAPPVPGPTEPANDIDEIERLASLHSSGVLSDAEFSAAKAKLLGV